MPKSKSKHPLSIIPTVSNSDGNNPTPSIRFREKIYKEADAATLVNDICEASDACTGTTAPFKPELGPCVRGAFKPTGTRGSASIMSSANRAVFDWHISKGRGIMSKTCSIFGTKDPKTGMLVLTAVGKHENRKGATVYKLAHWRDKSVTIRTLQL